jgi:hypothetical protein
MGSSWQNYDVWIEASVTWRTLASQMLCVHLVLLLLRVLLRHYCVTRDLLCSGVGAVHVDVGIS